MALEVFQYQSIVPAPSATVFAWHARPGAFERLAPPFEPVSVERREGGIADAGQVVLVTKIGPFTARWTVRHCGYIPGRQFRDVQVSGPFRTWTHTHYFDPEGPGACRMTDRIEYELPGGRLGKELAGRMVRARLERVFAHRHAIVSHDAAAILTYRSLPMKILVSGSTGLVGSALLPLLTTSGHSVTRLVRSKRSPHDDAIEWNPAQGALDRGALEGFDAVIHLAGERIVGRWTPEKKEEIRESRVRGTRLLCETLAALERPPRTLLCASAAGIYGDRGDETLTEESPIGKGFLADVCRQWESATDPAERQGIRVVNMRFSMILSPSGGALAEMLTPFRLGVGGELGRGSQYMSWIALDDALHALQHTLMREELRGPVNFAAPHPLRNREFTRILASVINRPAFFTAPAFALRLLYGDMADEVLLASQRMIPDKLQHAGYQFLYPDLAGALRHLLGKETERMAA